MARYLVVELDHDNDDLAVLEFDTMRAVRLHLEQTNYKAVVVSGEVDCDEVELQYEYET